MLEDLIVKMTNALNENTSAVEKLCSLIIRQTGGAVSAEEPAAASTGKAAAGKASAPAASAAKGKAKAAAPKPAKVEQPKVEELEDLGVEELEDLGVEDAGTSPVKDATKEDVLAFIKAHPEIKVQAVEYLREIGASTVSTIPVGKDLNDYFNYVQSLVQA